MGDMLSFLLLSVAVFSGAFVSGLAGFAFSAVAGAILLHVLEPMEAVPLMMACSVGVQATNLWALRKNIQWKQSLILMLGGLAGVPIAVWLLQNTDTKTFREVFGAIVALYAGYMLCRPSLTYLQMNQSRHALVGFGGGLIGGLTAMPGAIPTIWCDMHGVPKAQQRGLVQPFIAAMQIFEGAGRSCLEHPGIARRLRARHLRLPQRQRADLPEDHPGDPARVRRAAVCLERFTPHRRGESRSTSRSPLPRSAREGCARPGICR
jgi:uncharacterized membrane protein YfcA